jgi:murein DD-endopeptidase MepM/ murein hydrolase activator NlpD
MRNVPIVFAVILIIFAIVRVNFTVPERPESVSSDREACKEICGTVKEGETLFDIFKRYSLDVGDLLKLREASADIHRLRQLHPGQTYKIAVDEHSRVDSFDYWIDEDNILSIKRVGTGFCAEKVCVEYEKRIERLGGIIRDNLITSMGEDRERVMLALRLSDIFAWDIDFSSDLRKGDIYKLVVEGYYLDGEFKKYGDILSAEFVNHGELYHAYRFERNGEADYFDGDGKSLKRAFLKAPLNFRRISSYFSRSRLHPILRIYRPHRGLDYSAPAGTPVSAVGEGTVQFAGYKRQYGKLVIIKHANGWRTYYGHLSTIAKSIRRGKKIHQGQVIGRVGSTGLATGPHLHYELRIRNKPVNPLSVKMPRGKAIPEKHLAEFRAFRNQMDAQFASIVVPYLAHAGKEKNKKI